MYAYAVNVYLPKDRVTNMHQQYGFVEYRGEEDADYVSCSVCSLIGTPPLWGCVGSSLRIPFAARSISDSLFSCTHHASAVHTMHTETHQKTHIGSKIMSALQITV